MQGEQMGIQNWLPIGYPAKKLPSFRGGLLLGTLDFIVVRSRGLEPPRDCSR
jgi:hypothetical protein